MLLWLFILYYINNFNYYSLLEDNLINHITKWSEKYIYKNQIYFNKLIITLHENIKSFSHSILNKDNIYDIKQELKENINKINIVLLDNNYEVDEKQIKTCVEFILLSIVKIIENNHYDSLNILFELIDHK